MTPQQANISKRLRDLVQELRRTPKTLAEVIPVLFEAADELDRRAPAPTEPAVDRDSRYRFLLSFLIERGVFHRYDNGVWRLRGIYGVDDSGLKGAGRTVEEALDNAIVAVNLDEQSAEAFWRKSCEDALATPASPAVPEPAPLAPSETVKQRILSNANGEALALMSMVRDEVITKDFRSALTAFAAAILAPQVAQASQPTSAEGKDSERLCSFCDGKGGWGSGEDADGCTLCNGTGKDTDKEATK